MEIFDEFIVVDEKVISEFTVQSNHNCNCSFRDVSQFAALQFMLVNVNTLRVTDIGNASSSSKPPNVPALPLAQIVRWDWDKNGAQRIIQTHTLNKGTEINCAGANVSSIVIRILKKREKKQSDENAFLALYSSTPDDNLMVKIGDKKIAVSAHWLMSVSPVISRMLSVEMKEKQQRMITLDELGVDMDQFKQFLEAIIYLTMNEPFLPNPTNVLMLLKLADYFQVAALKSCCETHLINCVEIPLIDRFLLIERFGLDNLKNYFLHLDVSKLRAFFAANHEQFFPVISKELLYSLSVRGMAVL
ncbi:hypothetical protein niasHS_006318 [Heterodera schachtii]|uniref:BTB domain-containing protein n=1 Tax=Heterodera schachtii TaxID=97005 RepID=A0ABD2JWF0_HETSC